MTYHQLVWTLQETTNRWPSSSVFIACMPMIMAIMTLNGGHPW